MIIKICGITQEDDAQAAVSAGVHALGFVLWSASPRAVSTRAAGHIVAALPPLVTTVGVFVNPSTDDLLRARDEAGMSVAQVHGTLPEAVPAGMRVLRAVHLAGNGIAPPADAGVTVLLDAHDPVRQGGTGRTIDWVAAAGVAATRPVVLAGGLTAANVAEAIRIVRPCGVDVSSGVERAPGRKDHGQIAAFVAAARICP